MAKKWNDKPQVSKDIEETLKKRKQVLIGTEIVPQPPKKKIGRPSGVSYRQQLWDEKVKPRLAEMYDLAVKGALRGDIDMLKLILPKGMPKNPIDMPLKIVESAAEQIRLILVYHAEGHIGAEEAVKLSTIVKDRVMVGEMKEFSEKLAAFELWMKDREQGITINADKETDNHGKELHSGRDQK